MPLMLMLLPDMAGVMRSGQHVMRLFFLHFQHRGVVARLRHPAELSLIQVRQCLSLFSPFLVVHLRRCDLLVKQGALL